MLYKKSKQGFTRLVDFGDTISSRTKSASPKFTTGFTLIELLVVVAIISLLSGVVMASLNSARNKAKDAAVMVTVRELQNALELYHTQVGSYPATENGGVDVFDIGGSTDFSTTLAPLVTGGFISKITDHPDWPNNANYSLTGFFEYQTNTPEYPDGSGDLYTCGGRTRPAGGYVLFVNNPRQLDLPHFGHLHSNGTVTDELTTFTAPAYYYCVMP